ncbi:HERC5, partial [Symbiodinium necroappetens]
VSLHHKHRKPAELKPDKHGLTGVMRLLVLCVPGLVVATFVEQRTEGVGFQCALLRFNSQRTELSCWGQNDKGQLGQGDTLPRPTQQAPVLLGAQVVQVSSGAHHSCALLQTGEVKCWGANNRGQLGLGDSANRGDDPKEMGEFLTPVGLGPCKAVEVRLGLEHSCGPARRWAREVLGCQRPGAGSHGRSRLHRSLAMGARRGFGPRALRDWAASDWPLGRFLAQLCHP